MRNLFTPLIRLAKRYPISFWVGALCMMFMIFFLWFISLAEGRGPALDGTFWIVQLGVPKGLLYETLNLPLQKYGIDIPFFPIWMIVGGYLAIAVTMVVEAVWKHVKKNK